MSEFNPFILLVWQTGQNTNNTLFEKKVINMTYISIIRPTNAKGSVRDMYEQFEQHLGFVPNHAKAFSHRPEVQGAWHNLIRTIYSNVDSRRFELATVAAARGLQNTYCMMAHGKALLKQGMDSPQLESIARDYKTANLPKIDVAIMSYAEKVAKDASTITSDDIQNLRDHGLSDTEIFDIAATVAARSFFATLMDALGVQPDSDFLNLDESLRTSLTVGREVSTDPVEHV